MLNARLVALVAVLVSILLLLATTLHAQDAASLPQGIQNVDVDGQAIDAVTVPVTNNPTPEISGRADPAVLGASVIELAVGDAEPILFSAELDDRGRFRATVPQPLADGQYSLAINGVPVGAFTVDSTAQVATDEQQPRGGRALLDIARVVPYPVDFGDLLPGAGFLDGRFYTLDEEAARTAAANGSTSADALRATRRSLADAGWLQRYENRLAVPNSANPDVFDVQISSFVVEYASPENASAAFATLTGDDQPAEFPLVGEESMLTLQAGTTPDTGSEYQAARLVFRVGSMLGMIVYADLLGQPPDLALFATVAQNVAGRGAVVANRDSVPLGAMALRLDPTPATGTLVRRDLYDVRAGALTALYNEDEATRESRIALFTGTTDAFSSTTNGTFATSGGGERSDRDREQEQPAAPAAPTPTSVIAIEGESPAPATAATPAATITDSEAENQNQDQTQNQAQETAQVFMTSALYAFPGESEADSWLNAQRERLLADTSGTFTEVPDAPTVGDASATFATARPSGAGEETANGFRLYSRVGAIVAVLEIGSSTELPLNIAARLMELQVGCIEATGCAGLASLAGRMVGGVEAPATEERQQARVEEPRPERAAEPRPEQAAEPRPERAPRAPRQRDQEQPPPVEEPGLPPVEEPPPAEVPTPIPIEEPSQPPVEEGTPPPIEEGAPPPVEEGTPPPVEEGTPPAEEPPHAEEPTQVPGEEPTPIPGEEPTPIPGEEPTPVPGEEPAPAEEPTQAPVEEPAPPPAEEPTVVPTPGPVIVEDEPVAPEEEEGRDRDRGRDRGRDRDRD